MYEVGDVIIYGSVGVSKIADITTLKAISGMDSDMLYYVISPLYENGTIYTPVDTTKVFMRPIISKEEAESLIDSIPSIQAEAYHNTSVQQLSQYYESIISTHNCSNLIEMTMSIYNKKKYIEAQNRKFGLIDEKYMRKAENLIYGEFSVALGIQKEEVQKYIQERVNVSGNN